MLSVRAGLADPAAGPARRERLAALVDAELRRLWDDSPVALPGEGVALVAVGSQARRDAGPASDLDLVLLHDDRAGRGLDLTAAANALWYPLWDSGVRIDHSVRSVSQCKTVAADDLAAAIGLLDLRPVVGDGALALRTREVLREQWRKSARGRLEQLSDSLEERSRRHGELAYLIEGDLKEARGGLRDVVVAHALVATWLADLPQASQVAQAANRLLDVRDALHAVTGKATERLQLAEQDSVAVALGIPDADALLQEVAEAARIIGYGLDLTLRRARGAAARRRGLRRARPQLRTLEPGLVEHDGELCLSAGARPDRDASLAVRAAAAAAWHKLPLSPVTAAHLCEASRAGSAVWSTEEREALLRLLGAGESLVGVWETLDQVGLIVAWFPEWQEVRNRPQRNAIHRHTVDRHLIETCVIATELADQVTRPDLLLICALLHDIGKRAGAQDHSRVGAPIAFRLALRLGLPLEEATLVERMVAEHLTLVELATRRDPDDPETVKTLLTAVDHNEAQLALLRALTEADARAAGPGAWTPWRRRLVDDLVTRARSHLAGEPMRGPAPLTAHQHQLVQAARDNSDVNVIVTDLDGGQVVTVVAPDRGGLVADVAGVLAAQGLNVRSALIRTVGGVALDTWSITAGHNRPEATIIRTALLRLADGDRTPLQRLQRREQSWRPGRASEPGGNAPRVLVVPEASTEATVLEVRAVDRPGLLHALGATLHAVGVNISSAHISTHAGRAVDVVYVTEPGGGRLSAARTGAVVGALMAAATWQPPSS